MAAVTAVHAEFRSWEQSDWGEVAGLYDLLTEDWPSPVVALNRAVAIGFAHGLRPDWTPSPSSGQRQTEFRHGAGCALARGQRPALVFRLCAALGDRVPDQGDEHLLDGFALPRVAEHHGRVRVEI